MKTKNLIYNGIGKGVWNYDLKHDILLLKVKNLLYEKSVDIDDYTIHFDPGGLTMGLEIEDASKVLDVSKEALRQISFFRYDILIKGGRIQIKILLLTKSRNKELKLQQDIERVLEQEQTALEVSCSTK
ncbi:MAG TPA: DUF2283 domain-containing protein [Nanoarchaeota archaeon]|nr:DUF2283 domain-containing protein [Candidatus Woesearchaeota archaeon]HIH15653.1 DUF2283 domain-containing protein [Nanoarchaeota archaeon]HIH58762.1 DUF2283 domain-containing protein [Nanoarchaeota archaeon]HII13684.1 DUF2283 domain-containing protein [Nanoarchaeota archaeon]HIJ05380.1 DUF2283 domain-containing protein [Nanoarchaeota archaeon]